MADISEPLKCIVGFREVNIPGRMVASAKRSGEQFKSYGISLIFRCSIQFETGFKCTQRNAELGESVYIYVCSKMHAITRVNNIS